MKKDDRVRMRMLERMKKRRGERVVIQKKGINKRRRDERKGRE